ncbi:MAG TPA: D-2-hydroxyacid dehydrogenase [Candidatus Fimivivens faecavium]|nr:D-2-hydroxyacid dehydrogenase [Candidatus Fimivivens faecavium]
MKIVILDGYTENPGDLSWEGFEALGELTVYDRTPAGKIVERIGDADAVIVNKVPLTRETFEACPSIKYVGVLATGYDVVDVACAKERGIPVCNIPTYGTTAVSQYVFALLLEICHHVWLHSEACHSGEWERNGDWCFWKRPLIELAGKTMGIIGFGRIGRMAGKIAQAFGMNVLAFGGRPDRALESETLKYAGLDELLAKSDVISLHCPLFPETRGIINKENIAKMKDGVIIINTSRGPLINEADLAEALNSGKVFGAAVDVVSAEPIQGGNPLLTAKNCIITPHIAWAPKESRQRLMDIAADDLKAFIDGKPINVVNP